MRRVEDRLVAEDHPDPSATPNANACCLVLVDAVEHPAIEPRDKRTFVAIIAPHLLSPDARDDALGRIETLQQLLRNVAPQRRHRGESERALSAENEDALKAAMLSKAPEGIRRFWLERLVGDVEARWTERSPRTVEALEVLLNLALRHEAAIVSGSGVDAPEWFTWRANGPAAELANASDFRVRFSWLIDRWIAGTSSTARGVVLANDNAEALVLGVRDQRWQVERVSIA